MLGHRFRHDAVRLPAFLDFQQSFRDRRQFLRRLREAVAGLEVSLSENLPSLSIAVDDVRPGPRGRGALRALAAFISDNPQHTVLLGCHGATNLKELQDALGAAGVNPTVAHVGPFGRRELRHFVEKVTGEPRHDLVEQVTTIIGSERLPRTPFVVTALVAVLVKDIELSKVNESSLLDAWVSYLLGLGEIFDDEDLELDFRNREHLLQAFAKELTTKP